MANTGYEWSAWAFMQKGAADWDADALADNATETGDALSLSGKAGCIIGIALAEDNTGAIDGASTIFILGETDLAYEETTIGSPYQFQITPVQNDTVHFQFPISPQYYDNFKIAVLNEGGQELAVTVKYKTASIPVAS